MNHIIDETVYGYYVLADYCKICGKTVEDILNECKLYPEYILSFPFFKEKKLEYLNKYSKCLTDDEYIIKNIIE